MKVISLWSGGKDSCLACYKARLQGYDIKGLLNFTSISEINSLSHGLTAEVISRQARMTGTPFFQKAMPKDGYRDEFRRLVEEWKKRDGIEGIVFGDIFLQEHKDWIDSVCRESGVTPIMPLWGKNTALLIDEFIKAGFRAVVVCVRDDILGEDWLGQEIDDKFVKDLKAMGNIDLCGEKGEFHTFVYDGPIFQKSVEFKLGKKTLQGKRRFLELR